MNVDKSKTEKKIIEALKTVYDPEMPVNVYDLGLIYNIDISDTASIDITMTLTNPNCPVADKIPNDVKNAVQNIKDVNAVNVNLVFEPQWTTDMISDAVKLDLGLL